MEATVNGVKYYYHWLFGYQKEWPTIVCLHGFTGSSRTFLPVFKKPTQYNVLLLDLIGHGKTSSLVHPYHYQFTTVCEELVLLTEKLGLSSFSLFGYSMGARVALGIACLFPLKVEKLFLESGSPGLATTEERCQRKKSDQRLAQEINQQPLEDFVDKWESLSLFVSQQNLPARVQANVRKERLGQEKFGLICSLWFMGTGVQPDFWPELSKLAEIPTLLIVGELDPKFIGIAQKMQEIQPKMTLAIIENAGHCVHLEQPKRVEELINFELSREEKANGNLSY